MLAGRAPRLAGVEQVLGFKALHARRTSQRMAVAVLQLMAFVV